MQGGLTEEDPGKQGYRSLVFAFPVIKRSMSLHRCGPSNDEHIRGLKAYYLLQEIRL